MLHNYKISSEFFFRCKKPARWPAFGLSVKSVWWVVQVRYDTIWKKSLTWTRKLSVITDQLNLAHVARKKYKKEKTKTN